MPDAPRWKTLSSRTAFRGAGVAARACRARLGDGPAHARPTVDFGADACCVAARAPDGRWVLVGRESYASRTFSWKFPGGPLVRGERPEGAGAFELSRAAGMAALAWERLGETVPFGCALDLRCAALLAEHCAPSEGRAREDASVPVRLATDAEMADLARRGEISDACTLAAWALISARTKRGNT